MRVRRIGLFGGTFNPVHLGHLRAALEVEEHFALDRILFIPSHIPPHKNSAGIADSQDRCDMLHMGIDSRPSFEISDVELCRQGPSYTIDTIRYLSSHLFPDVRLYFILGEDAFFELDTWKSYLDLLQRISLVVMARPGSSSGNVTVRMERVGAYLKSVIASDYTPSPDHTHFVHPDMQPVYFSSFRALNISATHIRHLIRKGRSIQYLVPERVEMYIKEKGLYL
jgi:nicotinate-nucleotide adenylyltransferase